ncbi:MAG: CotH kinase family protein [Dysgonamonadaceae bacterium]|jgi:hypothetical protein|nr:CotH kinase family protein [Dysgonamonadaceae bacterium]
MKSLIIILFTAISLPLSLHAQDLDNYQKLRGAVLATVPDNDYTRHRYNAFDTNEGTSFMARDVGGWVGLDLGAGYVIRKIRIYPMPDREQQFVGSRFQVADNPEFNNPQTLLTIVSAPAAGKYTVYDIIGAQAFRYVRCMNPDHRCSIAELEYYADKDVQPLNYRQLTNLPTIYLETQGNFDFVNKETYVTSKVAVVNDGSTNIYDAQVRGRGNSTWEYMEKKPFRIKFDKKQHFLGLPANAKSWTLIALAVDKTLLRNGLAFEISKSLGFEFTPSCVMVDVVLDGFYYGTYMASDHIEINENRINIDEMSADDITEPAITGGYHLEIDAYADQEPVHFYSPRGLPFTVKSPENDLAVQYEWIKNHIAQTEKLLFEDPDLALSTYIDLESAAKYYIHSELTGNCDSYWCIPCYKKRGDNKLYFGPVWDYDQAFQTNERVPLYTETLSTQHGVAQFWFRQIMQTPAARQKVQTLWKQLKSENLEQRLLDYLDEKSALLQQSQALNFERWNSLNRKVWFEVALFDTYGKYIDFVKQFIKDRFAWFDALAPARRRIVLPTSASGNPLKAWKYTFDEPDDSWSQRVFNDSPWQTGNAPFGTEQNLQNTLWNTNKIFIRTTFELDENLLDSIEMAYFTVWHDEDCQIYLNGNLALTRTGYSTSYQTWAFDKSFLTAGTNTLAVKCVQTAGGQLIDVGVSVVTTEQDENASLSKTINNTGKYIHFVHNGILTIRGLQANETAMLYSIDGRLIKQLQACGGELQFALPARGIYLVRLKAGTLKIVN